MANSKRDQMKKQMDEANKQTSVAINGSDNTLDFENATLKEIIRQTTTRTTKKYGAKTNGKSLDYFTELSLSNVLVDATVDKSDKKTLKTAKEDPKKYLKDYMVSQNILDRTGLLSGDIHKQLNYQNYDAIFKHIPECSTALKIYRDNILSPDDFTKQIFIYDYIDSTDDNKKESVKNNIKNLIKRYKLNEKTTQIIQEALIKGDSYYAVLSLDAELTRLLSDPTTNSGVLQENIKMYDINITDMAIDRNDIHLNESQRNAFEIFLEQNNIPLTENEMKEKKIEDAIANLVNEHFVVDSKLSMLQERAEYELSKQKDFMADIINPTQTKKKSTKKVDTEPLYLSGSSLKYLDPSRVIELTLDDICYGYYYYEEHEYVPARDVSDAGDYLGLVTGKSQSNVASMGSTGASVPVGNKNLSTVNLDQSKYQLISDVFLGAISKKINKEYVRHNKEFKDFIYSVVKQNSFLNKRIHLTYFTPDEVVPFKVDSVYKNITFFAKLYLAMLTNMVIINMGRGHDKRLFYVQTGLDEQFEAAISNTIESIKSKEFRLSDSDINTVVSLNPGALDDWFIPTNASGDRPIEIETVPGMDIDIANNNFLDWLRRSMMNGMYIPANLIDSMNELDYARTLSAQNANFVRSVVAYQQKFQESFTLLIQKLYKNEYRFNEDGESEEIKKTNIDKIEVSFPSPASLNMTNMQEQISVVSQISDELANVLVPSKQDGSTEDLKALVRAKVFKKFFTNFDYEEFDKIIDTTLAIDASRENLKTQLNNPPMPEDNYGY